MLMASLAIFALILLLIAVIVPLAVLLIIAFARRFGLDVPRDYANSDDVTFFRSGL